MHGEKKALSARFNFRQLQTILQFGYVFAHCFSVDRPVFKLPLAARFEQSGFGQFLQVMRDGRLRDGELIANRAAAHLLRRRRRNLLKDLEPSRVSKRFGHFLKMSVVHTMR
jgi:hypothetical protein